MTHMQECCALFLEAAHVTPLGLVDVCLLHVFLIYIGSPTSLGDIYTLTCWFLKGLWG